MSRSDRVRAVSTAGLTAALLDRIRAVSPAVDLAQTGPSADEMRPALANAEVLLTHFRQTGFDPALAPALRWVQLTSASVEQLIAQPIIRSNVTFTNSSGIHAVPIGEYAIASLLAFRRHSRGLFRRQEARHWAPASEVYESLVAGELRGSTLGILGYGSIGREVARLGSCFGMRVLALKRDPAARRDPGWHPAGVGDPDGSIPELVFGPERLHEFLSRCDHVVLSCPLTPKTERIIDAAALGSMRESAYLVNVSRGQLVDEAALVRALRERRIAGAGLDVAALEPLSKSSELFDLDNVILTPHCSGVTPGYDDRATELFCENLRRYLAGEPLLNVVSRDNGY